MQLLIPLLYLAILSYPDKRVLHLLSIRRRLVNADIDW